MSARLANLNLNSAGNWQSQTRRDYGEVSMAMAL